jgi:hypothetical protein
MRATSSAASFSLPTPMQQRTNHLREPLEGLAPQPELQLLLALSPGATFPEAYRLSRSFCIRGPVARSQVYVQSRKNPSRKGPAGRPCVARGTLPVEFQSLTPSLGAPDPLCTPI